MRRILPTAQIAWAPNFFSHGQSVLAYEVSIRYPVTHAIEISGTLGFNQAKDVLEYDYLYWDAGFSWFFKYMALDFRYVQSAYPTPKAQEMPWPYDPEKLDPSFVFSISVGF